MGFLSKIFKPIKKVFKKIGKGIKSAFKKFGKFMNKLGPLGTIAMGIMLPGIGSVLGGAWSGLAGTLAGSSNALLATAGNFMTKAASFGSAVSGTVSNITGTVTDILSESVRAIGKQVGLGKIGPEGMKTFFNKSTGDFLGENGFLERVQNKFGSRMTEVAGRWNHFGDHLTKTNQMYRNELLKGTYEPYKGYVQHDSILKGQMSQDLQTGMTNMKEALTQERAAFLENVDLKSDEGKFLRSQFDEYEKSLFESSDAFGRNKEFFAPDEMIKKWEGEMGYSGRNYKLLGGQGQAKGFSNWLKNSEATKTFKGDEANWFRDAQTKVKSFTDLKPTEWQDMVKNIDTSQANTGFQNFQEGLTTTFSGQNLGEKVGGGAVSAGISAVTNVALAGNDEEFKQPGVLAPYFPTQIQPAPELYGNQLASDNTSYLFDPDYGMNWRTPDNYTAPGNGIYGTTMRSLVT